MIETHPAAAEGLRLLLAKDWMAMGQEMAASQGGSVLMVDPQSPASLLAALKGLQETRADHRCLSGLPLRFSSSTARSPWRPARYSSAVQSRPLIQQRLRRGGRSAR